MDHIINKKIEKIAKEKLSIETLKTRGSDSMDFSEHSIWSIQEALEAAFNAGFEYASKKSL